MCVLKSTCTATGRQGAMCNCVQVQPDELARALENGKYHIESKCLWKGPLSSMLIPMQHLDMGKSCCLT